MTDYPVITSITDATNTRVAIVVNKELASVPLLGLPVQPKDATLTALAALDGTAGFIVETGADTFVRRTLTSSANNLTITNPAGTAGDPVLDLAVGAIASGTWTPTITGTLNVQASTAHVCNYIRVGAQVTCSGTVEIDPTAASLTTFGLSLPIASALTAADQLNGSGANTTGGLALYITGDAANDRASGAFTPPGTANIVFSFTFGYRII